MSAYFAPFYPQTARGCGMADASTRGARGLAAAAAGPHFGRALSPDSGHLRSTERFKVRSYTNLFMVGTNALVVLFFSQQWREL